ncbi:MAG: hypothetical protein ACHREM_19095, partial [Polyangiales bacterium]
MTLLPPRRVRSLVPLVTVAVVVAVASSCGARTGLLVGATTDAGDASTIDAPSAPSPHLGVLFAETTRSDLSGPEDALATFYADTTLPPACVGFVARGTCSVTTCPTATTRSLDGGSI